MIFIPDRVPAQTIRDVVAAIAYTTWNSPDRRTCAGSLGSIDTNYEPTHYHSE